MFIIFLFQRLIIMIQLPGPPGWVSISGWNHIPLNQGDGDRLKRSGVPYFGKPEPGICYRTDHLKWFEVYPGD
jgi:hypothetical protein